MAFKPAMELKQLQQEKRHVMTIDDQKILFIWHKEQVHAIQSQCPHLKLPLVKGVITDDCAIVCPFHKSEFDLNTGETKCWSAWPPVVGPLLGKITTKKDLRVYPTHIEDGQIMIDL
ncbi:Rieske (2Fe-2S) protein [Legionella worsleiensis]|uniref:Rieske domain-containing protein, part of Ubiquinol-cytochrome c reductase n=1 Tax=Legionella worsleiensis TaxID=45076 RepID=A0A0W1AEJ7_9GAMM|nr:Rieske (2Fe-2S) protein [Legionella worsleiensis]KTD79766.1 Rieske domain-containing protein, part of Ubiquinol-cytochrome c reductase [Legionella worsleiensis]STY32277.1 Rieske domain-containing protein. Part of Ubiquinol-cytochrome c reductase (bc1 complex or complex III) [Legionella worsleiensis]